jgi:hypothetical protein
MVTVHLRSASLGLAPVVDSFEIEMLQPILSLGKNYFTFVQHYFVELARRPASRAL